MAVTRNTYSSVIEFIGTGSEVAEALADEGIPQHKWTIFYNGTNVTALCKMK